MKLKPSEVRFTVRVEDLSDHGVVAQTESSDVLGQELRGFLEDRISERDLTPLSVFPYKGSFWSSETVKLTRLKRFEKQSGVKDFHCPVTLSDALPDFKPPLGKEVVSVDFIASTSWKVGWEVIGRSNRLDKPADVLPGGHAIPDKNRIDNSADVPGGLAMPDKGGIRQRQIPAVKSDDIETSLSDDEDLSNSSGEVVQHEIIDNSGFEKFCSWVIVTYVCALYVLMAVY